MTTLGLELALLSVLSAYLNGPLFDTANYYNAWTNHLYDFGWNEAGGYVYSPAFAQVIWPLTLLPWPAFAILWTAAIAGSVIWLVGPVWGGILLAIPGPISGDLQWGNIHAFVAVAIVVAARSPSGWVVPLLTKVTPAVALTSFLGSRNWRGLWTALLSTASVVAVSALLSPHLWADWIAVLASPKVPPPEWALVGFPLPVWLRVIAASVVAYLAGRLNLAWLLPVAVWLAMPALWKSSVIVLLASVPLARRRSSATKESQQRGSPQRPDLAQGTPAWSLDVVGARMSDQSRRPVAAVRRLIRWYR